MVTLTLQDAGSALAIFIYADIPEELELKFNSLYNFGCTSGKLHYWTINFAHIWTTRQNLWNYLESSSLAELLQDEEACKTFKGIPGGLMGVARQIAEEKLEDLFARRETVINYVGLADFHEIGEISAEKQTDFSDDKEAELI